MKKMLALLAVATLMVSTANAQGGVRVSNANSRFVAGAKAALLGGIATANAYYTWQFLGIHLTDALNHVKQVKFESVKADSKNLAHSFVELSKAGSIIYVGYKAARLSFDLFKQATAPQPKIVASQR